MLIRSVVTTCSVAAICGLLSSVSWAASHDKNTTGLPTYPQDPGGTMDSVSRSLPNGQHCIQYASDTPDSLEAVEVWYKKALPTAKVEDVNVDSLYGSFKLDGIKLLTGNDIVNVYRTAGFNATAIEIFKCKDAAQPHS